MLEMLKMYFFDKFITSIFKILIFFLLFIIIYHILYKIPLAIFNQNTSCNFFSEINKIIIKIHGVILKIKSHRKKVPFSMKIEDWRYHIRIIPLSQNIDLYVYFLSIYVVVFSKVIFSLLSFFFSFFFFCMPIVVLSVQLMCMQSTMDL